MSGKRKHWYSIVHEECVLCSWKRETRTRVFRKKDATRDTKQTACAVHFH